MIETTEVSKFDSPPSSPARPPPPSLLTFPPFGRPLESGSHSPAGALPVSPARSNREIGAVPANSPARETCCVPIVRAQELCEKSSDNGASDMRMNSNHKTAKGQGNVSTLFNNFVLLFSVLGARTALQIIVGSAWAVAAGRGELKIPALLPARVCRRQAQRGRCASRLL
jgi:hypothetical protein